MLQVIEDVEAKVKNREQLAAAMASTPKTVQDPKEPELVKDIENMKTQMSKLEFKLKEVK